MPIGIHGPLVEPQRAVGILRAYQHARFSGVLHETMRVHMER